MRTTVTLDDDVFEAATGYAEASGKRLAEDAACGRHGGRLITLDTRLPAHSKENGLVKVIQT